MAGLKIAHGYPISQTYLERLASLSGVEVFDIGDLLKQEKETASKHGPDSPEAGAARQKVDEIIKDVEIYYSASLPGGLPEACSQPEVAPVRLGRHRPRCRKRPPGIIRRHYQRPANGCSEHRRVGAHVHIDVQKETTPTHSPKDVTRYGATNSTTRSSSGARLSESSGWVPSAGTWPASVKPSA